jgi:transcription termination factor Rho
MDRTVLGNKALSELREIASTLELRGYQRMKKADLIDLIVTTGSGGPSGSSGSGGAGNGASSGTGNGAGNGSSTSEAAVTTTTRTRAPRAERARTAADEDGAPAATRDGADAAGSDGDDAAPSGGQVRERHRDGGQRDGGQRDGGQRDGGQGGDQPMSRSRAKRERRRKNRSGGGQGGQGGQQYGGQGGQGGQQYGGQGGQQYGGPQQSFGEPVGDLGVRDGILDLLPEGYGFLRTGGYLAGNQDVYVSQSLVRRHDLRRGDRISGPARRNKPNDKFPALMRVDTFEGEEAGEPTDRPHFKDLTPLFPTERLRLELEEQSPIAMRLVDMMAPIGKGQRGLIVSPPKAGKTTVLKQLAHAIEKNNPETHLMVVLVDERPEEVTDFKRSTGGEVISSTFDRPAEDHTQVAELAVERAKRLVEQGRDVVILLDSITRLGRAYNLAAPASGRILSGGIDSAALYPPKRFFGAARNIEEGGSLTVIATALIDTGSKMDEVIFEEFKGTGNMELRLDRRLEQKRIFPAIDIQASGTRREELLLGKEELETIWKLRRLLASMESEAALQLLIDKLRATRSNDQFLQMIAKSNLA